MLLSDLVSAFLPNIIQENDKWKSGYALWPRPQQNYNNIIQKNFSFSLNYDFIGRTSNS